MSHEITHLVQSSQHRHAITRIVQTSYHRYCGECGKALRSIVHRDGTRGWKHCEHPARYIEPGDGYIPSRCERCGVAV